MTTSLDVRKAEERARGRLIGLSRGARLTDPLPEDFLALADLARRLAEALSLRNETRSPLVEEARAAGLLEPKP